MLSGRHSLSFCHSTKTCVGHKSLNDIAAATSHSDSYVRTRTQLAFLSPKIQNAILVGSQPPELTLEKIIRKPIPLDWDMQARIYGFSRDLDYP